ncbi:MAG: PQQ-dependent sugar dehydrogenase [Chitinophagaceae bacterium]|nr:PQQ-dependent sugar dehydrogenase [Chitinophagaceae bacterium]
MKGKTKLIYFLMLFLLVTAFTNNSTQLNDKGVVVPRMQNVNGLQLPDGFKATVMAEGLGRARHLAVNSNGDVYVKLERLKDGKGIYRLRDTNADGVADNITGFGDYIGTGIAIKNNYLYASSNDGVFRYKITNDGVADPETIVKGLVNKRQHESKSLALDNAGNMYVNIGAPSNVCQEKDRTKGSPGRNPCPILDSAGGIWQFKAEGMNQSYAEGTRYATGLRNVVGLDWNNEVNDLYVTQHGRDMLFQHYPELFDQKSGANNPAEEMFRVKKGADCGWPYCYFDNDKNQKLLNPEFGGDRNKVGVCDGKVKSIVQFPGHLAPNALLFYTGKMFPEKYKNGAFIAFHGSWNRAPEPQAGYFVVFVPFKSGMPSGKWEVFADGFAGEDINRAKYRPCGLAQGPDGALYVSDDNNGTIWKITYSSN